MAEEQDNPFKPKSALQRSPISRRSQPNPYRSPTPGGSNIPAYLKLPAQPFVPPLPPDEGDRELFSQHAQDYPGDDSHSDFDPPANQQGVEGGGGTRDGQNSPLASDSDSVRSEGSPPPGGGGGPPPPGGPGDPDGGGGDGGGGSSSSGRSRSSSGSSHQDDMNAPQPAGAGGAAAAGAHALTEAELARIAQMLSDLNRGADADKDIKVPNLEKAGTDDWRQWRNTFERVARLKGWDEDRRKNIIIGKMRGEAVAAVEHIDTGPLTSDEILMRYEERFIIAGNSAFARQQFLQAKQERTEQITAFHTRIITLYRHAHPAADCETVPEVIERFSFGLYHPKIQGYVFDKNPRTMTEALNHANMKYATMQALAMTTGGARGGGSVNNINEAEVKCWKCNKLGHFKRNCPTKKKGNKQNFNKSGNPGGGRPPNNSSQGNANPGRFSNNQGRPNNQAGPRRSFQPGPRMVNHLEGDEHDQEHSAQSGDKDEEEQENSGSRDYDPGY